MALQTFFYKNQCPQYEYRWLVSLSYNRSPNVFVARRCSGSRTVFYYLQINHLNKFYQPSGMAKIPFLCVISFKIQRTSVRYFSGVVVHSNSSYSSVCEFDLYVLNSCSPLRLFHLKPFKRVSAKRKILAV